MQRRCWFGLLAVLALSLLLLLVTAARSQQVVHLTSLELELPDREPLPTPPEQVRVICSLPEFQARPNLNATVVVFAWRRLESLRRLTRSLERAEYCGTEMPLLVLADVGASPEVLAYVTALQWSHGAKRLYVHKGSALGTNPDLTLPLPLSQILTLTTDPNPNPNPGPNPDRLQAPRSGSGACGSTCSVRPRAATCCPSRTTSRYRPSTLTRTRT